MAELLNTAQPLDAQGLRQAFDQFNNMSEQLSSSYLLLENKVAQLPGELDDISKKRLLELAEKERLADRLKSLLNLLPGGVIVLDGNGRVAQANPAAESLLVSAFSADEQHEAMQSSAESMLVGLPWVKVIRECFKPQEDDGHEVSTTHGRRLSIATRSLETEPGQLILLTDLTQTRQLQAKLSQHQRLNSMGRMVASLAHQIRTPLSSAMLYAGHLTQENLPIDLRQRFAGKTLDKLRNIEQQIRDMLIFSNGQAPLTDKLTIEQLQQALKDSIDDVLTQHNGQCHWEINEPVGHLLCSQHTLIGALTNLVNNALEAGSNQLDISFKVSTKKEHEPSLYIDIKDNGSGMSDEVISHLFEPFFTTKSKGTGLGLCVVQAVIRAHYGSIDVTSITGGGSHFTVVLPLTNPRLHSSDTENINTYDSE
jgi:two-component system sensor histidine kinase FlrB